MRIIYFPKISGNSSNDPFSNSIRFSPPLVISEDDLLKAVEIIRQALIDLDQVRLSSHFRFFVSDSSCLFAARRDSGRGGEREGLQGSAQRLRDLRFRHGSV